MIYFFQYGLEDAISKPFLWKKKSPENGWMLFSKKYFWCKKNRIKVYHFSDMKCYMVLQISPRNLQDLQSNFGKVYLVKGQNMKKLDSQCGKIPKFGVI